MSNLPTLEIPCFWLEPTTRVERRLRRYRSSSEGPCGSGRMYCNAVADYDEIVVSTEETFTIGDHLPHNLPQWPTKCEHCDYVFKSEDTWQVWLNRFYKRADTGEEMTTRLAPFGAMWDLNSQSKYMDPGPDGIALAVKLPDANMNNVRLWTPDEDRKDIGGGWQRTGDPRKPETLSITPSILASNSPRFHAYLTNGKLQVLSDSEPWYVKE